MANKKLKARVDNLEVVPAPKSPAKNKPQKAQRPKNKGPKFGQRIAKVFREMISELKKVDWPPFKRTKNNPGVWANTGTVLVVVAFFLVIITAFDAGLAALLRLLTKF